MTRLVFSQPLMFGVVVALCGLILAAVFYDPLQLFERRTELKEQLEGDERSRRYQSNRQRNQKMEEIDQLLEKVGEHGLNSLSKAEREQLDKYSQELRGERTR